jgi:hypothetical protein
MRAYILDSKAQKVQIGNKIFNLTNGKTEVVHAHPAGIFKICEAHFDVPVKSMEGAQLAIALFQQRPKEKS